MQFEIVISVEEKAALGKDIMAGNEEGGELGVGSVFYLEGHLFGGEQAARREVTCAVLGLLGVVGYEGGHRCGEFVDLVVGFNDRRRNTWLSTSSGKGLPKSSRT